MEGHVATYFNRMTQWWLLFLIDIPKIIKETMHAHNKGIFKT